jgi:hypothetical protein
LQFINVNLVLAKGDMKTVFGEGDVDPTKHEGSWSPCKTCPTPETFSSPATSDVPYRVTVRMPTPRYGVILT